MRPVKQINVEELPKNLVKAQGVSALPRMSIYRAPKSTGSNGFRSGALVKLMKSSSSWRPCETNEVLAAGYS